MSKNISPARTKAGPCRFLLLGFALVATAPFAGCGSPTEEASSISSVPREATVAANEEAPTSEIEPAPSAPTIRLAQIDATQVFEVVGLSATDREAVAAMGEPRNRIFSVFVESPAASSPPPMLGSYTLDDNVLRFTPRYPLRPGLTYRAVFDRSKLPGPPNQGKSEPLVTEFSIPEKELPPTALLHVYPSAPTLPENQLKFYFEFSAPMTVGSAYDHIVLLDSSGEVVDAPFLELDEELWDPAGRRFTLFIDPGRIKREVKPREEVGPALLEGNRYTLVVSGDWPDAHSNPLAEEYRKDFEVGPPDHEQPDPATWKLAAPAAGTTDPLAVTFPEPLDYGMLHRVLSAQNESGEFVAGQIQTQANETRWLLAPAQPWTAGEYQLMVETTLEDLAGNSIAHPFEVDVLHPIEQQVTTQTVSLPFSVQDSE
jgi:hypothetical protein